jgi:glutamate/tyrosine decarboxylase-like PLP-dependent enzyme
MIKTLPHPTTVSPSLSAAAISERLSAYDFKKPRDLPAITSDVADLLARGTLHSTHPRYFGLFIPGVLPSGEIADSLVARYNPLPSAWWHAPAACEIERVTLSFFKRRLGLPAEAAASFTSGGSEANLCGVLAALAAAFPGYLRDGLASIPERPALYVSDQAHDSFVKVARIAGLGDAALKRVPSDRHQRMRVDLARQMIAQDRRESWVPFLVAGTFGTTATGAIDPLADLGQLCREEGLWLHCDAAWGGLAALTDRLAHVAGDLAVADSVTWDAHKALPVPLGAGMFFCRHPEAAAAPFAVSTGYIPQELPGKADPYRTTIQWSRRFTGLKVFFALSELGESGLASLVDRQVAMADRLRGLLGADGWQLGNDTPLPVVCFRRPGAQASEVQALADAVVATGDAWISVVRLPDGQSWLRACITHHETSEADIRHLMALLRQCTLSVG